MKKILLALALVATVISGVLVVNRPVFADGDNDNKCTNILPGNLCDETGDGQGVKDLLMIIVDIMTVGVGILGVVGVIIVGIQYLTASGSEEKTRKAKRRLFEIVIGVAAFVLIGTLIKFLVPSVN